MVECGVPKAVKTVKCHQVLFFLINYMFCVCDIRTRYIPDKNHLKNVLTAGAPYKTLCFILGKIISLFGLT